MRTRTKLILTLACTPPLATAGASAAEPPSAYDRAAAALGELKQENDALRRQLAAAARPADAATAEVRVDEALHVNVPDEALAPANEPQLRDWRWDFGDGTRASGFNAAHAYAKPGRYNVTLNGAAARTAVVSPDARPVVTATDERSLAAALGDARPQIVEMSGKIELSHTINVRPGKLLRGRDAATLFWSGGGGNALMLDAMGGDFACAGVTFDSAAPAADGKAAPDAIRAGGRNVAVTGCRFLNVTTAVNGNGRPDGVLVAGCEAPLIDGLRGYFVWGEGTRWVLTGNRVANSTRESPVRLSDATGGGNCRLVVLAGNDFANVERPGVDKADQLKSAIKVEAADYVWLENNTFRGVLELGPLGGNDGLKGRDGSGRFVVCRGNAVEGPVRLKHGVEHLLFADNRVTYTGNSMGGWPYALAVDALDPRYTRPSRDLVFRGNTFATTGGGERMAYVAGEVPDRLAFEGNTFLFGKAGGKGKPALCLEQGWRPWYASRGNAMPAGGYNAWPDARATVQVGSQNDPKSYLTPEAWLALPGVSGDEFGGKKQSTAAATREAK